MIPRELGECMQHGEPSGGRHGTSILTVFWVSPIGIRIPNPIPSIRAFAIASWGSELGTKGPQDRTIRVYNTRALETYQHSPPGSMLLHAV